MMLDKWAYKWKIPKMALDDLRQIFGINDTPLKQKEGLSEASILNLVKLEATQKGLRLWRNNVGAAYMQDGSFLRYGLANESSALNKRIKSADLIGIRPIKIESYMIGWTIGQFVSREIKANNWKYAATEREQAQLKWAELILSFGGDAGFANREGTL